MREVQELMTKAEKSLKGPGVFFQQEDVEVRLHGKRRRYSGYRLTAPMASTSEPDFLPL